MAYSINRQTLKGRLGRDAETRTTNGNQAVTSFSMATDYSFKKKGDPDWIQEITWHNVVAWNLSENLVSLLTKGKEFLIEGRTSKRKYKNREGVEVEVTEVVADKVLPCFEIVRNTSENNNYQAPAGADYKPDGDLPF